MLIKRPSDIRSSEITPESVYNSRRNFIKASGIALAATAVPIRGLPEDFVRNRGYAHADRMEAEDITPSRITTSYNNFYEFGTDKEDPAKYASQMTVDPWSVEIEGLVGKPGTYSIEDLLAGIDLEERIYRLRCVEAWSIVVPWIGFPVKKILDKVEPLGSAKYVKFTTLFRKSEMRVNSFFSSIDFPYVEGLRLDEANHPLAIFAVGMYGRVMPKQNGAPIRLVVPWKYGFKSIKSIVKIELTEEQPDTTWNLAAPQEYGFYSNVNPKVHHPRWRQNRERRLSDAFFAPKIDTLMFNGYGDQVASLYSGMNLKKNY